MPHYPLGELPTPIYNQEPLPGESPTPAQTAQTTHAYHTYERAASQTARYANEDDLAMRKLRSATPSKSLLPQPQSPISKQMKPPGPEAPTQMRFKAVSGIGIVRDGDEPNPKYVPPAVVAPKLSPQERAQKQTDSEHSTVTKLFEGHAKNNPELHPEDIRSMTERSLRSSLGVQRVSAHSDHLQGMSQALGAKDGGTKDSPGPRAAAMSARASARGGSPPPEDTSNQQEISGLVVPKKAAPRASTDVNRVARQVTQRHYNSNPIKDVKSGQMKPFEGSAAQRSPMKYMSEKMGIQDPESHINENYGHLLPRGEGTSYMDEPLGQRQTPLPSSPSKSFVKDFARSPLGAHFAAGRNK
jgi:hypothetical protein